MHRPRGLKTFTAEARGTRIKTLPRKAPVGANAKIGANAKKRKLQNKEPRDHKLYNTSILRSGIKNEPNANTNAIGVAVSFYVTKAGKLFIGRGFNPDIEAMISQEVVLKSASSAIQTKNNVLLK